MRLALKIRTLRIATDLRPSPLQLYGKRAAWEDPSKWVNDTYPWNAASLHREGQSLLQLRPEDVGYDGYGSSKEGASSKQVSQSDTEGDPLVRERFRERFLNPRGVGTFLFSSNNANCCIVAKKYQNSIYWFKMVLSDSWSVSS